MEDPEVCLHKKYKQDRHSAHTFALLFIMVTVDLVPHCNFRAITPISINPINI